MSRTFTNAALRRVLDQPASVSVEYPEDDLAFDSNGVAMAPHYINPRIIINSIEADHLLQECLAVVNQLERLQADHDALRATIAGLSKNLSKVAHQ